MTLLRTVLMAALVITVLGCGTSTPADVETVTVPEIELAPLLPAADREKVSKRDSAIRAEADKVVSTLDEIDKELAPIRTALAGGKVEAAAAATTPETIQRIEMAQAAAEKLAKDPKASEEEKSTWQKIADVLLTILRILFFLFELFGKGMAGQGGGTTPVGKDKGGTRVMVPAPKGGALQSGKTSVVGTDKGRHLVRLDGSGDDRTLSVALEMKPDRTYRLKLPAGAGGEFRLKSLSANSQTGDPFPIKASATIGGAEVGLRWEAEGKPGAVTEGRLRK